MVLYGKINPKKRNYNYIISKDPCIIQRQKYTRLLILKVFSCLNYLLYFPAAILRNEIGWFDDTEHTSSMLASRLESDATLLRTVVVDRSSILIQNIGLVVTSFIIAFILNWRLTLVVIATYPLIISGHIGEVCCSYHFPIAVLLVY